MHKRHLISMIGTPLLAGTLCLAVSATQSLAAPSFGRASGAGVDAAGESFVFLASGTPTSGSGFASITFPSSQSYPTGFTVKGDVTCYRPVGANAAVFAIRIGQGSKLPPGFTQQGFVFSVHAKPDYMGTGWHQSVVTNCYTIRQGGQTTLRQGSFTISNQLP